MNRDVEPAPIRPPLPHLLQDLLSYREIAAAHWKVTQQPQPNKRPGMMMYIIITVDKDRWDVVFQDTTTKQYIVYPVVVLVGSPISLEFGTSTKPEIMAVFSGISARGTARLDCKWVSGTKVISRKLKVIHCFWM